MFKAVQFYPTSPILASDMQNALLKGRDRRKCFPLLEPSAGKGDLLKGFYSQRRDVYCLELDPDLQATLTGQGYRVIGSDFLEFNETGVYPSIIMNPPFNDGIDHLLHAWSMLSPNGRLVCLLPKTAIAPDNAKKTRLINMIQQYGYFEDKGSAFADAERKTDIPVVMIVLDKPAVKTTFDFSGFSYSSEDFESAIAPYGVDGGIARRDVVKTLVQQYEMALHCLKQQYEAKERLKFALIGISSYSGYGNREKVDLVDEVTLADAVKELRSRFWQTVFAKTELESRATSDFQKKFTEWEKDQITMAFTEQNIKNMLLMFWQNKAQIDIDSLCHVFDQLTRNHANCVVGKGWKTNKASRLNTKVIIEYGVNHNQWGFSTNYHRQDLYQDIDKAMCILSGKKFLKIQGIDEAIADFIRSETHYTEKFESEFFTIRIFKKGTVHLWFKDLKLNDDFNLAVAKHRKWIGSDY